MNNILRKFVYNSLNTVNQMGLSKRCRRRAQIIKFKESHPEKFKKISVMRSPDLRDPSLEFPINIPLRFRYIYQPVKNAVKIKSHDIISFDAKTGNEILLYLEKAQELRSNEITNALVELGKRKGASEINWNEHEYIQNAIEQINTYLPQYKTQSVSQLCLALHRLNIHDQVLWAKLEKECSKLAHKMTPTGFGYTFIAFVENMERASPEFQQKLKEMLPMFLWKMNPILVTKCFDICVKNKIMSTTDHLFENHFLVLFWRRNKWFGASNYALIIRGLVELNYNNHDEFWQKDFLPQIQKMKNSLTEDQTNNLIKELQNIKLKFGDTIKVDEIVSFLQSHLLFCQTRLKAVENTKFYKIILNDLQTFKDKQKQQLA